MLKLFILETCPYCHKVMDFLENEHIKYEKIDIIDIDIDFIFQKNFLIINNGI